MSWEKSLLVEAAGGADVKGKGVEVLSSELGIRNEEFGMGSGKGTVGSSK